MDRIERLTSYLDGELDSDERRAFEAELAEDSALRAELEELERSDALLRSLRPTELPEGARERLDEALAPVLGARLTGTEPGTRRAVAQAPTTSEALGGTDELTRRRERRRGLLPALAGIAAAAAVVAVGITTIGPLGPMGGDDAATDDSGDSMAAMDTDAAGEESAAVEAAGAPEPVVIDDGRRLTEEELDTLLDAEALQELASRGLGEAQGVDLARDFQQQLLAGAPPGAPDAEMAEEEAAEDSADGGGDEGADGGVDDSGTDADTDAGTAEPAPPLLATRDGRTLTPADAEAVTRCLEELLTSGEQAIPVTVELLEVDGVPAVSFGLVTLDPETARFTRSEVWTLARSDCQVLRFAQS